jgi:SAM-dependent methyltransferase
VGAAETRWANRRWWDETAQDYQADHAADLDPVGLLWCPEGLTEAGQRWLGDVRGARVLEVGCGAAQGSRWVAAQGGEPVALDLSLAQLREARRLDRATGLVVPTVTADASDLPFRDAMFDAAFAAFGALQFVAEPDRVHAEVFRVLRPGAPWVVSITHPIRWCFLDRDDEAGLVVLMSYFDRRPYVEQDADGRANYAEHHRTVGDRVSELVAAGFVVEDLVEPEWPPGRTQTYGQWGEVRGEVLPGTLVLRARKPSG